MSYRRPINASHCPMPPRLVDPHRQPVPTDPDPIRLAQGPAVLPSVVAIEATRPPLAMETSSCRRDMVLIPNPFDRVIEPPWPCDRSGRTLPMDPGWAA